MKSNLVSRWLLSTGTALLAVGLLYAQPGTSLNHLKANIEFLTSDSLEGRDAPGPKADITAKWLQMRLEEINLAPTFGDTSYTQVVPLQEAKPNQGRSVISLSSDTEMFLSNLGQKLLMFPRTITPIDMSAELYYCGYGLSLPGGRNDYPAEVEGKAAIVFAGSDLPPAQAGMRGNAAFKAAAAERAGATALVVVYHDSIWPPPDLATKIAAAERPVIDIPGEKVEFPIAYVHIPKATGSLLSSFKNMNLRLGFKSPSERPSLNVSAKFPGLEDEWIIVGAHYDHLGKGFPGADDNASGTSGLLELAERWSHKKQEKRGVIFVWFTAEEDGLMGSQWFASHLPVDRNSVVAMINLDMIGRDGFASMSDALLPDKKPEPSFAAAYFSGGAPALQNVLRAAANNSSLNFLIEPVNSFRHFGDSGPFHEAQIPTMHIFSGFHSNYHEMSDTPDKIDYNKLGNMVDLTENVVQNLTEIPERPTFDPAVKVESKGMGY